MTEHVPVMTAEVMEALKPWDEIRLVIDATLGLGGHSLEILRNCRNARLIGLDQDPQARGIASQRLSEFKGRWEIKADNFRNIAALTEMANWRGADAVLFDLGVSNLQITEAERGFSFQEDGPLDMRMDCGEKNEDALTAKDIIGQWSIKELTELFREYGEDPFAYQIARGIVRNRENGGELRTTADLTALIRKILPALVQRKMGGHPARKIFQALRIAVNDEINALDEALEGAIKTAAPGARIIVISYHSLEDRMVKKRFRRWTEEALGESRPRKAITPAAEEIAVNYKSRSAKLRVFSAARPRKGG